MAQIIPFTLYYSQFLKLSSTACQCKYFIIVLCLQFRKAGSWEQWISAVPSTPPPLPQGLLPFSSTYSLIFWSTSQGDCQVTRSRLRNPVQNHSESMFLRTPFISCTQNHSGVSCSVHGNGSKDNLDWSNCSTGSLKETYGSVWED